MVIVMRRRMSAPMTAPAIRDPLFDALAETGLGAAEEPAEAIEAGVASPVLAET